MIDNYHCHDTSQKKKNQLETIAMINIDVFPLYVLISESI